MDWVYSTIDKMREAMPGLAIRTTFIVGYPGETEEEFGALLHFVEDLKFDRLGAFQFSFEQETTSAPLGDPIPQEIKEDRFEKLMQLQQSISLQKNQLFLGQTLDVLVEGNEDGISVGRSYRDARQLDEPRIINPEGK